jgi:hypothetical protein
MHNIYPSILFLKQLPDILPPPTPSPLVGEEARVWGGPGWGWGKAQGLNAKTKP